MKKFIITSATLAALFSASTALASKPQSVEFDVWNKTNLTAKVTPTIHGTTGQTITLIPGAAHHFNFGKNGLLQGDTLNITYLNNGTPLKTTLDQVISRYNQINLFPSGTYKIPGVTLLQNHNNVPYAKILPAYKYEFVIKNQQQ